MLKRFLCRRSIPPLATPIPDPPSLSQDQDQDTINRSQTGYNDNEATAAVETKDDEAKLAHKFVLERQRVRMRDELAKKRLKEASLLSQVDELSDEVRRLEKEVKNKDAILNECVERLHEQGVSLGRLQREKEETEEILDVAADTIRETRAQVKLLEEWGPLANVLDCVRRLVGMGGREVDEKKEGTTAAEGTVVSAYRAFSMLLLFSLVFSIAIIYLVIPSRFLPFRPVHQYHCRVSSMTALMPGGPALETGEYLTNCRHPWLFAAGLGGGSKSEIDGCATPHFLWMQDDGLLVLYQGWSPHHHGGPVWATHPVDVTTVAGYKPIKHLGGKGEDSMTGGGGQGRRIVRALVDERKVLKLVRFMEGSGAEVVVFRRALKKLPASLVPWPFEES
ncbi:Hypothetical protein NocV09_01201590 [Nannochloropsis oceanica]